MALSNGVEIKESDFFVQEFLDAYLARGFGSLPKSEVDLLCFNLFQKYANLSNKTVHELSLELKLPEQKVTRLRYEAALRYEEYSEEKYKDKLRTLLQQAQFEIDKNQMIFQVEDKFLRLEVQHHLSTKGSFLDGSFNTALVRVNIDRFVEILHELYDAKSIDKIEKAINKAQKTADKLTFKLMLRKYFEGIATGAGRKTVDLIAAGITGGISEIPTLIKFFNSFFKDGSIVEGEKDADIA
jgi:hypothetical protein